MEVDNGLKYRSAPARRQRILEVVRDASFSGAGELSRLLGVSEMTIRRDIRDLADQGLVRAVHGGASRLPDPTIGTDYRLRLTREQGAKRRIAEAAVGLIRADSSIALDAGTTCLELARLLSASNCRTVVTPSLPALAVLAERPGIEVICVGGVLHRESLAFAGPAALSGLSGLRVNQLFLAASAIGRGVLWSGSPWDAQVKREFVEIADEVIVLADSSKFSATAMYRLMPLSAIQVLVVDDGVTPEQRSDVEAEGVDLVVARASTGTEPRASLAGAARVGNGGNDHWPPEPGR